MLRSLLVLRDKRQKSAELKWVYTKTRTDIVVTIDLLKEAGVSLAVEEDTAFLCFYLCVSVSVFVFLSSGLIVCLACSQSNTFFKVSSFIVTIGYMIRMILMFCVRIDAV